MTAEDGCFNEYVISSIRSSSQGCGGSRETLDVATMHIHIHTLGEETRTPGGDPDRRMKLCVISNRSSGINKESGAVRQWHDLLCSASLINLFISKEPLVSPYLHSLPASRRLWTPEHHTHVLLSQTVTSKHTITENVSSFSLHWH